MKNYAIVGFIYSQACPLSCNFCCHTKSVVGKGRLTPDNVGPVVLSFSKHPQVTRFAFSGGDPFLFYDEICEIMRSARRFGVSQPFHMVTSGFWAIDDNDTERKLAQLKELGMDALDVSYDHEHARFVSRESIYRIGKACGRLGLKLEIFGNFWHPGERVHDLLPEVTGVDKMYSSLVMPIGAARVHFHSKRRYELPDSSKYSCGKPRVYDVAIYPDGAVYPCCSGGFNKEAGLQCGNVFVDDADDILRTVFNQFHARIAKEVGFDALYRAVELMEPELLPKMPRFAEVDSVCEICRDIHSNGDLMANLSHVYEELEIAYALQRAESDWHRLEASRSVAIPVKPI